MKRATLLIFALLLLLPMFTFAEQDAGYGVKSAYGDWKWMGGRLVQLDVRAGMAQAHYFLPQTGVIQYEFDVKYLAGGMDGYAAFGAHIGIDKPHPSKSWGNGKSFLLWLTYDPKTYGGLGVYGQAYKSASSSVMGVLHKETAYAVPPSRLGGLEADKLAMYSLPVKIVVDYDSGWCKVYDPVRANYYYKFTLGQAIRGGRYVALRTSSLACSFGNFKVTKLR